MADPMWKTTIVIWTDYNPSRVELYDLAREAQVGDAFCPKQGVTEVADRKADPDWSDTDFFGEPDRFE